MASSSDYFEPSGVAPLFTEWLKHIAELQEAAGAKEKQLTSLNHSKLIASELLRNGLSITSSVDASLEKLQKLQDQGDTIELAIVINELSAQWTTYRIAVQNNAQEYFMLHQHEDANFVTLYFRSITFASLFNDVWDHYVRTLGGGRQLALLNEVAQWLIQLSKPDAKQARLQAEAQVRLLPEQSFPFSSLDIKEILKEMEDAAQKQTANQLQVYTDLITNLRLTREFHTWLASRLAITTTAVSLVDSPETWIIEDNAALDILKQATRETCGNFLSAPHLLTAEMLQDLATKAKEESEERWKVFDGLKDKDWPEAYTKFVHAHMNWARGRKMHEVFQHIHDPLTKPLLPNPILPTNAIGLQDLKDTCSKELTAAHIQTLHDARQAAHREFKLAEKKVWDAASSRDQYEYMRWILQHCADIAKEFGDHDPRMILKYLTDNANQGEAAAKTAMETEIDKDYNAVRSNAEEVLNCKAKAFTTLRDKRATIRRKVLRPDPSQPDPVDPIVTIATEACHKLKIKLGVQHKLLIPELEAYKRTAMEASMQEPVELQREVFTRQLNALYANGARKKMSAVMELIESKHILVTLQSINPDWGTLIHHVQDARTASTFGELILLVLRMTWVLHKAKMQMVSLQ